MALNKYILSVLLTRTRDNIVSSSGSMIISSSAGSSLSQPNGSKKMSLSDSVVVDRVVVDGGLVVTGVVFSVNFSLNSENKLQDQR